MQTLIWLPLFSKEIIQPMILYFLLTFAQLVIASVDLCDYRIFNWNFYLNHNKGLGEYIECKTYTYLIQFDQSQRHSIIERQQMLIKIYHLTFHSKQYCNSYQGIHLANLRQSRRYFQAVLHYLNNAIRQNKNNTARAYWTYIQEMKTRLRRLLNFD